MAVRRIKMDLGTEKVIESWIESFKEKGTPELVLNFLGIKGSNDYQTAIAVEGADSREIRLSVTPVIGRKADQRNKFLHEEVGRIAGEIVLGHRRNPLETQTLSYKTAVAERSYKCEALIEGKLVAQLTREKTSCTKRGTVVERTPGFLREEFSSSYNNEGFTLTFSYPEIATVKGKHLFTNLSGVREVMHNIRLYQNAADLMRNLYIGGLRTEEMPGINLVRTFNGKQQDRIAVAFGECSEFTITTPPTTGTLKGDGSWSWKQENENGKTEIGQTADGRPYINTIGSSHDAMEKDTRTQIEIFDECLRGPILKLTQTRDGIFRR